MQFATAATEFSFEAAHWLPKVHAAHKCRNLHGHNYVVRVSVSGPIDERGFVLDFAEVAAAAAPLVELVDHRCLNNVPGLENPTAELIAHWFLAGMALKLPPKATVTVRVYETPNCFAEVLATCP